MKCKDTAFKLTGYSEFGQEVVRMLMPILSQGTRVSPGECRAAHWKSNFDNRVEVSVFDGGIKLTASHRRSVQDIFIHCSNAPILIEQIKSVLAASKKQAA